MTVASNQDQVPNMDLDKSAQLEKNFAAQRKHYEKELERQRQATQQAEERAAAAERAAQESYKSSRVTEEDEEDDSYVDAKKLNRKLASFEKTMEQKIDQKAEAKAFAMIEIERRSSYLKENNDFDRVMDADTIQRFADRHPRLAENILRMPEGFERQKLVYENIKALGIDKPEQKGPSTQDKIDANRRNPYYQPSGVGAAPYSSQSDFSASGQKSAYDKMQELKNRLRI